MGKERVNENQENMIVIIDYNIGNLSSIQKAFKAAGSSTVITSEKAEIESADAIVLPGMGSFGHGMQNLEELGLIPILKKAVLENKKPLLGICLGMQLLATRGFEFGEHKGLDFIKGEVRQIEADLRLPHMGWNDIKPRSAMFDGLNENDPSFYFAHSFHFIPEDDKDIAATTNYGIDMVSALDKDNIFATQFHPEKSQNNGIKVLKNFIAKC